MEKKTNSKLVKNELIDAENKKQYIKLSTSIAVYGFFLIFGITWGITLGMLLFSKLLCFGIIVTFLLIISNMIATIILRNKINVFTQKGLDEKEQWKGLKKYMEDFSMLDKKELPEIVIWEKFLVYATVFGIEKKVLKQLKIVYPDIENRLDVNTYSYMNLMINTDFSNSFSNAISSSMSSAYSSSSGSGGGFSGGGGGGRWPVEVAVEDNTSLLKNI